MFVFRFKEALEKNNLKVIFMIFTDGAVCPGTGKLEGDLHDIYRWSCMSRAENFRMVDIGINA